MSALKTLWLVTQCLAVKVNLLCVWYTTTLRVLVSSNCIEDSQINKHTVKQRISIEQPYICVRTKSAESLGHQLHGEIELRDCLFQLHASLSRDDDLYIPYTQQ